ncbi:uncharacterized protein LOC143320703 [Chaetodon auriga]|uniref:uncharacterized protein LOC143320703 n=1 Tax=Chaetodon auriga TaxID=39042 RepID=UPI004032E046
MGSSLSCLSASPADDGLTRVTFLREDAAGVRSLYLTLWSEDLRPVTCEVDTSPVFTERYRAVCDRSGTQGQEISQRFNISSVLAPDAPCALVSSSAPNFPRRTKGDGTEGKARRKRAWIFPGTLWCGTGSRAVGYEQLGMFESTDKCCREHDHCLHVIPAFTRNYGVFNSKFFTVSHCDCDQRFRQCLLDVNDTISSMVGYSFFSVLQVPCFEFTQQRQCTEIYWWGMCKAVKEAPYAVFRSPLPYNTTDVTSKYGDNNNSASSEWQHVTESPAINTKSPRSEHRCSSQNPPRGDTFYHRRTKGKGCKRYRKLYTVAPSQVPSVSRAHNTTSSMVTSRLHASKSSTLMSNKERAGKNKSNRKGLSAHPTQRNQVPSQVTTNSYPQTTSTTQGVPSTTQRTALQLHLPTAVTAVSETTKSDKRDPKQSRCCGVGMLLRGDGFQPHCKRCLEQKTTSHMTTVTPSTAAYGLPIRVTSLEIKQSTETPKRDAWSKATSAAPPTAEPKTAASIHKDGKRQKQMFSYLPWNNTSQKAIGRTKAPNTHAERGLKLNIALHNMTDNQLRCRSLKHLDECKYKIPPLEKKYHLQNGESKTTYHCHCTSRMALQIESSKQPSCLPKLLMDFVSQYCFKLPKEKKCQRRKSCSGGFTKASDLLQALKKMEEKETTGVRNSGNGRKRGFPVRLYKRCLRLEREADITAPLT